MDATALQVSQVIFQALSSSAIAAGLIYTAVQFRRARDAQHVANFTKLVDMQMMLRKMRVDDPTLAAVYKHDLAGLNSDRDIREHFMNLMQLSVFEIVWFSHKHGQLPRDYFDSWVKRMRDIAAEDSFRKMITSPSMKILHDEFEQYIIQMVKQVHSEKPAAEG